MFVSSKVAVVSAVAEGQPADRAGVKTGWVVDRIGGKPVKELLKTAEAAYANTGLVSAHQAWTVISRLHGAASGRRSRLTSWTTRTSPSTST